MSSPDRAPRSLVGSDPFRRLWASQFLTVVMVYGLSLAGVVYLEEQTGSSAGTGLVILSSILPAFLASLVAGAVVDRAGRRPTLLVSHLSRALLAAGFWAGTRFLPHGAALAAITLVNVGTAIFGQFAFPAELSLVPDLIPADRVPRANALLQYGMLLGEGLGIIFLTPVLIGLWGVPAVGLSGALLCLAALLLVLGLPAIPRVHSASLRDPPRTRGHSASLRDDIRGGDPLPSARDGRKPGLSWADIKAGWKTIAADPLLRLVVLQATVGATLLLVLLALLPGLVSRSLGLLVTGAPYLILPGGLAFVLAAAVVSRRPAPESHRGPAPDPRVREDHRGQAWPSPPAWIAVGLIVAGLSTGLLGASATSEWGLALALAGITGVGLGLGAVVIPGRVILQQRPPPELRARVIAGQLTLANAAAVIPLLVSGSLADRLGLGPVMLAMGALAVIAGLAGARYVRSASLRDNIHRGGDPLRGGIGDEAGRDPKSEDLPEDQ